MKKRHWLGAVAVAAGVALTGCGGDGDGATAGGGNHADGGGGAAAGGETGGAFYIAAKVGGVTKHADTRITGQLHVDEAGRLDHSGVVVAEGPDLAVAPGTPQFMWTIQFTRVAGSDGWAEGQTYHCEKDGDGVSIQFMDGDAMADNSKGTTTPADSGSYRGMEGVDPKCALTIDAIDQDGDDLIVSGTFAATLAYMFTPLKVNGNSVEIAEPEYRELKVTDGEFVMPHTDGQKLTQ